MGQSLTKEFGVRPDGPIWMGRAVHNGRLFGVRYEFSGVHPDFVTRSGFIRRRGDVNLTHGESVHPQRQARQPGGELHPGCLALRTWTYDLFSAGQGVRDQKIHFNLNASLRGGWQAGASLLLEKFGYDPRIYGGYALEVPGAGGVGLDTVAFTGTPKIPNRDWVVSLTTPEFRGFSANGFIIWGQDENFFEWASANLFFADFGINLRPTDQLRIEARYRQNQYQRRTDGTLVGRQRIPRLKVEYQLARPLFIRLVGEYNAYQQDSLRDDSRTAAPILIYDRRLGDYARTAFTDNTFRGDVLLSFTPMPGTVFFAGYGTTMAERSPFEFRDLSRRADGFFLKGSYLFRIGG